MSEIYTELTLFLSNINIIEILDEALDWSGLIMGVIGSMIALLESYFPIKAKKLETRIDESIQSGVRYTPRFRSELLDFLYGIGIFLLWTIILFITISEMVAGINQSSVNPSFNNPSLNKEIVWITLILIPILVIYRAVVFITDFFDDGLAKIALKLIPLIYSPDSYYSIHLYYRIIYFAIFVFLFWLIADSHIYGFWDAFFTCQTWCMKAKVTVSNIALIISCILIVIAFYHAAQFLCQGLLVYRAKESLFRFYLEKDDDILIQVPITLLLISFGLGIIFPPNEIGVWGFVFIFIVIVGLSLPLTVIGLGVFAYIIQVFLFIGKVIVYIAICIFFFFMWLSDRVHPSGNALTGAGILLGLIGIITTLCQWYFLKGK